MSETLPSVLAAWPDSTASWHEQREEVFPEVLPFQKDMIVEVYEVPPARSE
jgi:hypothetical protein